MMEKIMKAVKSNSKRRGINITIGAVVGMLLSCSSVMKADEFLWIRENSGEIEFNTEITTTGDGNDMEWSNENPYNENEWDGTTYINNGTLISEEPNGKDSSWGTEIGYGLRLSGNLENVKFVNNGEIIGKNSMYNGNACGILIKGDNKGILINNGMLSSEMGNEDVGILVESANTTAITNNGMIFGKKLSEDRKESSGIRVRGENNEKIINNGIISMKDKNRQGIFYGIVIHKKTIEDVINNGLISSDYGGMGIAIIGENETLLSNNGIIYLNGKSTTGILENKENKGRIENNGLLIGIEYDTGETYGIKTVGINNGLVLNKGMILLQGVGNSNNKSYGMSINKNSKAVINNGYIKSIGTEVGTKAGYGIIISSANNGEVINNGVLIGKGADSGTAGINITDQKSDKYINNLGVVYGDKYAVKAGSANVNNYGILATKGSLVTDVDAKANNYGLYITGTGEVEKSGNNFNGSILVGFSDDEITELKRQMKVKNAEIEAGNTSTESIEFSSSSGEYDNFILNGKDKTIKVIGEGREVSGSIINAYGTAIVFDENQSNELTLSGTIINSGVEDDTFAVLGSDNSDKLVIQSGEAAYEGGNKNLDSIINGNVNMGKGADTLAIGAGTQINGTLDGGDNISQDTLILGIKGNVIALSNNTGEIKIQRDISNFENIDINTNVTLYEKTVGSDGGIKDLKVTGAKTINISAGGVLNLRIDATEITKGRYEGHALFGNTGLKINGDLSQIQEDQIIETEDGMINAGVLNLVTNGLGVNSIIAMDGITLDNELFVRTNSIFDRATVIKNAGGSALAGDIKVEAGKDLKDLRETVPEDKIKNYSKLNRIYKGIYSSTDDNFIVLRNIIDSGTLGEDYTSSGDQMESLLSYLGNIYTGSPYSYSSELSRGSTEMFRDIVTENEFRPNLNQWLIMGGLTHADGGTKDTYYGRNYHGFDTGTSDTNADMKLTGAYMLAKYGYSENTSLGLTLGGNKSEAKLSMSKVKGNSGYLGAFAENYRGNLTLKAGAGIQYSEYDADRRTIGGYRNNNKYSDMTYDIYLNGRYSNPIGDNLFLEPYATLSYTYVDQDGADEGSKALAIETDSKSFDYTVGKVGVDLKKVIPHEKGKSTLSAGVSYTRILNGADEEYITGRFKGESAKNFDILVAHKNEHSIGLNAKYALELENGVIFDIKGTYSVERDSNNQSGKNKTKGEWIVGVGLGYKF